MSLRLKVRIALGLFMVGGAAGAVLSRMGRVGKLAGVTALVSIDDG